jgi:hypothetical protein
MAQTLIGSRQVKRDKIRASSENRIHASVRLTSLSTLELVFPSLPGSLGSLAVWLVGPWPNTHQGDALFSGRVAVSDQTIATRSR